MKRLLVIILLLLVTVSMLLALLVHTQSGLEWIVAGTVKHVPGDLSIQHIEGRLTGPIMLHDLHYDSDAAMVSLDTLKLDWNPRELFFLKLHMTDIQIADLDIKLKKKNQKKSRTEIKLPDFDVPFQIIIDRSRLEKAAMTTAQSGKPFEITQAALHGTLNRDLLGIEELSITSSQFHANLTGTLTPKNSYPLDMKLDWNAQSQGYGEWRGSGELAGTLEDLRVVHLLESPAEARVQVTIKDLFNKRHWQGTLSFQDLQPQNIRQDWSDLSLNGTIEGEGNFSELHSTGTFHGSHHTYGNFSADFDLTQKEKQIEIKNILLTVPDTDKNLEIEGTYGWADENPSFKLMGKWALLSWPLTLDDPVVMSKEGNVEIKGTLHDYLVKLHASVTGKNIPEGQWDLKGKGNLEGVLFDTILAELLKGEMTGKGEVSWKPALAWDFVFYGHNLNPGSVRPEWPGRLSLDLALSGKMKKGKPDMTLNVRQLKGKLRDYPFHAAARVQLYGKEYRLSRMELTSGTASLTAQGALTKEWNMDWKLEAPDLAQLIPQSRGSVTFNGRMTGLKDIPTIVMKANAKRLAIGAEHVEEFEGDLRLDLGDLEDSSLSLKAKDLFLAGRLIVALTIQGKGKISKHDLRIKLTEEEAALDLAIDGSYGKKAWTGLFTDAYLASVNLGIWKLEEQKSMSLSFHHIQTDEFCWEGINAKICVQTGWARDSDSRLSLRMEEMPLEALQSKLPMTLEAKGSLNGRAELFYSKDKILTGEAHVHTDSGSLSYISGTQEPVVMNVSRSRLDAILDRTGLRTKLDFDLEKGGAVNGSINLSPFTPFTLTVAQRNLQGNLQAHITELGILPSFLTELSNTKGEVKVDLLFSGTAAQPLLNGKIDLDQAKADIPRLGIQIKDIEFTAASRGKGEMKIEGNVKSGPGSLQLSGSVRLQPHEGFPATLQLKGNKFEIFNLPEAWAIASPDLTMKLSKDRIHVEGQVVVPEATIEPLSISGKVPLSKDVVIVSEEAPQNRKQRREIYSKIRLTLGEEVKFDGFGLRGRITGSLLAVDEGEKLTTGQGELQVFDGKYKAYGQKLEIERGRMLFAGGPIDDPGLDVKAFRRTGDITSGVNVRGTLKDPQLELFSSPGLDQTDALSYLVLGRSSEQATGAEGEVLHNAAVSLGLSGGGFLAEKIGESLGVEDIEIEGGTTSDQATLFVGRYLSPRLYVSYGIGIFEPVSIFRMRYQISSKWMLESEYGFESGADLIYKIER